MPGARSDASRSPARSARSQVSRSWSAAKRLHVGSTAFPEPDGGGNRRAPVVRLRERFRPSIPPASRSASWAGGTIRSRRAPPARPHAASRTAERPVGRDRVLDAASSVRASDWPLHGAAALSAAELIGVLWGSGTHGLTAVDAAADALRRHEGLVGLARATDVELEAVPGVGPVRAAQLAAAFELGRRVVTDWPQGRWTVRAPRDVGERLVPQMGYLEREELRVVLLNTRNAVLRLVTVYQGNVSSSLVRIGELFRDAVRLNASRPDPGPQPPLRRPDAQPGRPAPDGRGPRRRPAAGHPAAGPPDRRGRRIRVAARSRRRLRPARLSGPATGPRPSACAGSGKLPQPAAAAHAGARGAVGRRILLRLSRIGAGRLDVPRSRSGQIVPIRGSRSHSIARNTQVGDPSSRRQGASATLEGTASHHVRPARSARPVLA